MLQTFQRHSLPEHTKMQFTSSESHENHYCNINKFDNNNTQCTFGYLAIKSIQVFIVANGKIHPIFISSVVKSALKYPVFT